MSQFTFQAHAVTKTFPGVVALDKVNLSLTPGSVHALLGENGAGKSTLIKIMTGVHRHDAGHMEIDGTLFAPQSTREAIAAGVGVVHQERNVIPRFSVAENIFLETLSADPWKPINYPKLYRDAEHWLDLLEIDADPSTKVEDLPVAKIQLVEIAKALALKSRILMLDEPTASLTQHETERLFSIVKRLRDDGVSLVFVSHKLEEVQEICDQVTVLRDGRNACESQPLEGLGRQDIVRLMIGRTEQIPTWSQRDCRDRDVALELRGVATQAGHTDVSLSLHKGEVLGLYGLVGSGRTELAKAIIGADKVTGGEILVEGTPRNITSVADALHQNRIGYVSEDRKSEGLILMHSVLDNAGITVWRRLQNAIGAFTDRSVEKAVSPVVKKLEVRTPSLHQTIGNLSGGNQQKVSVAKWLAANVSILIIDEPTVGVDIKTKAYVHELIRDLADAGTSVLLITSDMPEMVTVADRILVMDEFQIRGEVINDRDYDRVSHEIMQHIHGSSEVAAE
ncbi:sugar ABC transporter ATP-binding protein [Jannaschia seohaensis]|uniref:Ribose transport system ATP-binding protein n=1 Tax=Jannaschia seohaensis TaxID=475081 RepID=A0A2Y9B5H6_9RHOB|nr:sugar ABC transporter ATP-binding protein [Jannaschia seohaensis]PWJ11749.1 ribose transport system ATP-binding protein [Jannaschia seohaensis]SSA51265.1 ribose transport system ATP-binding protein [Jannaschia seohaensis]